MMISRIKLALRRFFGKAFILIWRSLCSLLTKVRHPFIHDHPNLLSHYLTEAQLKALATLPCPPQQMVTPIETTRLLVVIPFRDKWSLTEVALESLFAQKLQNLHLMIALVDNGSAEETTRLGVSEWLKRSSATQQLRALRYDIPFNFSELNNRAIRDCQDFSPDFILFMNNDIQLLGNSTLCHMAHFLSANPSGASVGCTLLYPGGTIQHLFIFVGSKIVGAHPCKGRRTMAEDAWMKQPQPVGAATGALLMVRAEDYAAVGGFDEALPSCYQDVDLALKFQQLGKINWVLPYVTATHYETMTRDPVHNWQEVHHMYEKWGDFLRYNPYISKRFSRWSEQPVLSLGEGPYPWHWLDDASVLAPKGHDCV